MSPSVARLVVDVSLPHLDRAFDYLVTDLDGVEHAFERARASGKAEDDTRIRIFFVLALYLQEGRGFSALSIRASANR